MAIRTDIYIDKKTDFETFIDFTSIGGEEYDINGYTFYASARKIYSSKNVFDFDIQTSENTIIIKLSSEASSDITPGKYQYDVLMVNNDSNIIYKAIEGVVHILPTMTTIINEDI